MMRIRFGREKIKRALIISLPMIFALTAAVAVALLVRPLGAAGGDEPKENVTVKGDETKKDDVEVIAPVETSPDNISRGLRFLSKGNGTCALVGIGDCTDRIVVIPMKSPEGDAVVELAAGAFSGCGNVVEVVIPDSIVSIAVGAFFECEGLEAITVGEANPLFSSDGGVLYNKSRSTLICYPSGKSESVYVLPKSVVRIGDGAFYSCPHLVELKYLGTRVGWQSVAVGSDNGGLDGVTVVCVSADK